MWIEYIQPCQWCFLDAKPGKVETTAASEKSSKHQLERGPVGT